MSQGKAGMSQGKARGAAVPGQRAVTELSLSCHHHRCGLQHRTPARNRQEAFPRELLFQGGISREPLFQGGVSREPLFQGQLHPSSSSRLRILSTQEGLAEPWKSLDSPQEMKFRELKGHRGNTQDAPRGSQRAGNTQDAPRSQRIPEGWEHRMLPAGARTSNTQSTPNLQQFSLFLAHRPALVGLVLQGAILLVILTPAGLTRSVLCSHL